MIRRSLLGAFAVAALTIPAALAAQAPRPVSTVTETPATRRARQLVALWNGQPSRAAYNAFVDSVFAPGLRERFPREQHTGALFQMGDNLGGVDSVTVQAASDTSATLLVRSRLTGSWSALAVAVTPDGAHQLSRPMQLRPPPAGMNAPRPRPASTEAAGRELDGFAKGLADADAFSGGVLVGLNGRVLFTGAYGMASRELAAPNRVDTRYNLGSINKMFTTVSILQLMEAGKISLDDPVSKWLPGVLRDDVGGKIRIRHLLTHTSGLGDFLFTPEMEKLNPAQFRAIADYLPLVKADTGAFEPGSRWAYSNTGFLLLGAIVEKAGGQPYEQYVREHVFAPAGMTDTEWPYFDQSPRNVAFGYERELVDGGVVWSSNRYNLPVHGSPAGGGVSTVADMFRFMDALRTNKLLKAETTQLMLSPKPEMNSPQYGFGTQIFPADGMVGHTGGGPGTRSWISMDPRTGLIVIVLGNSTGQTRAVVSRAIELYKPAG
ncbi:MAG TPA: serine hydrolase domain-containing protein [Longimicrobium sp.]|nr:serine hydrolase domain-containing protein [Longimicrobium sp.]